MIYEVFRQEEEGESLRHVGSVEAPRPELAVQYARETFARRNEALRLWVVPRAEILEVADADFLRPPLDRTYRLGEAYRVTVAKRHQVREQERVRETGG